MRSGWNVSCLLWESFKNYLVFCGRWVKIIFFVGQNLNSRIIFILGGRDYTDQSGSGFYWWWWRWTGTGPAIRGGQWRRRQLVTVALALAATVRVRECWQVVLVWPTRYQTLFGIQICPQVGRAPGQSNHGTRARWTMLFHWRLLFLYKTF